MKRSLVEGHASHRRNPFSRRRILGWWSTIGVSALLCCVIAVLAVRGDNQRGRSNAALSETTEKTHLGAVEKSTVVASSSAQQAPRVEAEVITIRPTGFEPREITRPKGLFVLAVENRSGLQVVQLRLDREAGLRLRDVQMPRNKHDWKDGFDLSPGRYVLSEAYHPNWACSITITSN